MTSHKSSDDEPSEDRHDTNKINIKEIELDFLANIHDKVIKVDERLKNLEGQIFILAQNIEVIHQFQRSFADRLSGVEKFCVERPLRSIIRNGSGNGE